MRRIIGTPRALFDAITLPAARAGVGSARAVCVVARTCLWLSSVAQGADTLTAPRRVVMMCARGRSWGIGGAR